MADDVGAPFDRPAQVGRGQGVVDYQRQIVRPGDGPDLLKGKDDQTGIAKGLA
jgi:hypothetical protein